MDEGDGERYPAETSSGPDGPWIRMDSRHTVVTVEVIINFLHSPYTVGGLIVCVIALYLLKDGDFLPRPIPKDKA